MNQSREDNPIRRYQNKPTRKNAIHAFCCHCMGCSANHLEPGFRQFISGCKAKDCPLFPYRPFVDSGKVLAGKGGEK